MPLFTRNRGDYDSRWMGFEVDGIRGSLSSRLLRTETATWSQSRHTHVWFNHSRSLHRSNRLPFNDKVA